MHRRGEHRETAAVVLNDALEPETYSEQRLATSLVTTLKIGKWHYNCVLKGNLDASPNNADRRVILPILRAGALSKA